MNAPSSHNAPDKETRILEAAIRVFARSGYHNSTVADVAAEAGVAAGTIYLYFKRKEELLGALFRRYVGDYLQTSRDVLFSEEPGSDQLRRFIELQLGFFEARPELARVFQIHLREINPGLQEEIGPTVRAYFNVVDEVIDRGVEAKSFVLEDRRLARQVVFGALDSALTAWALSGPEGTPRPAADALHGMLARALGSTDKT